MFVITNPQLQVLGNTVSYYTVMPFVGAFTATICSTIFAYFRKKDANFIFRSMLCVFYCAAFFQHIFDIPIVLLPFMYMFSCIAVVACLGMIARIFRKEVLFVIQTGIAGVMIYFGFSKIGCFLVGCCHGNPYSGILNVAYKYGFGCYLIDQKLFPIQLLTALVFFIGACVIYAVPGKKLSVFTIVQFVALVLFIYYGMTNFCYIETRHFIINGIDVAGILTVISGLLLIGNCVWMFWRSKKDETIVE